MILEPSEQFKKFLDNSQEILILIPENPSSDAVGSAWALYYFLEKRGSSPTIAFSNNLSPKFSFLPQPERITNDISGSRDFVLSFNTERNKISHFRHEEKDGKFNIYLTPEKGSIDPRDFSFILAKFKYDLLIVIDSPDLDRLGKIYSHNTDLFFEVPIINIDHCSHNDNFGQINLVDVTASSCSEIVGRNLEEIDGSLLDKTIATCLLTGIIGATDSFQKKNTTPQAFLMSARLMEKGADQPEIIRWLYKTHPFHVLKLWGRAMAKMKWEKDIQLIWSEITVEDFVQSRSSANDLPFILEKFQESYSEGKLFMVLYQDTPSSIVALIKSTDEEILQKLSLRLEGELKNSLLEIREETSNWKETGENIAEKIKNIFKMAS